MTLRSVRLDQFRQGHLHGGARVDTLTYDRLSGRIEASPVTLRTGDDRSTAQLKTARATILLPESTAALEGGVDWTGSRNERLQTSSCALHLGRRTAEGHEPTTVVAEGVRARGDGFTASFDQEPLFELKGAVEAHLELPADDAPRRKVRR